jgi:hypothetical protein
MSPVGTENQVRSAALSTNFDNEEETDTILGNFRNKSQKRNVVFDQSFAVVILTFRAPLLHKSIQEKQLLI